MSIDGAEGSLSWQQAVTIPDPPVGSLVRGAFMTDELGTVFAAAMKKETSMNAHPTLRIIRDEHGVLSAVLRSISLLLVESRRRGVGLDYKVLRAMLFYIDEFPERVHHPKETSLLFPKLRARAAGSATILDRLDRDHASSHQAVRDLEHQVLELEMMGDSRDFEGRRTRFEAALQAYVTSYLDHIRLEETEVLPLAERLFTERDWAELDDAFMKNRDPLTYRDGEDEFRPLFKRILMTLPAPLGLGPAMQALGDSYPRTAQSHH
jgi:hemerythrin-like domain-containing protein